MDVSERLSGGFGNLVFHLAGVALLGFFLSACAADTGAQSETETGSETADETSGDPTGEGTSTTASGPTSESDSDTSETSEIETSEGESESDSDTEPETGGDGQVLYLDGRTHSPITAHVATHLRTVVDKNTDRDDSVFAKIGASSTVSKQFMHCFSGDQVDLGEHEELAESVTWFQTLVSDTEDSYTRESLSATVGWAAFKALEGNPSPLQQEVTAIEPRYAVILYGTNDIGYDNLDAYANDMLNIADTLLDQGVIPVLSSIMPRDDNPEADAKVPRYNQAVRAIAQARQVPFIDYYRELIDLPDHGLGPDNLHPSVYTPNGTPSSCLMTNEGLQHGYTIRNLLTLEALDRLRQVVSEDAVTIDTTAPTLVGEGSLEAPFQIPHLPFAHHEDTDMGGSSNFDTYPGCMAEQDESGPEFVYRLDLDEPTTVRMHVFDRGAVDIDLHLLDESASAQGCLERNDRQIVRDLAPGTYFITLDTFVNQDNPDTAGEYVFMVLAEE